MSTLHDALHDFTPALTLERLLSRKTLSLFRISFFILTLLGGVAVLILFLISHPFTVGTLGVTLLFFALWLEQILLFAYHNSFYYRGLNSLVGLGDEVITGATYDVIKVVAKKPDDITFAFCTSSWGSLILLRSGVEPEAVDAFLAAPRQRILSESINLPSTEIFSLIGLGKYLITYDTEFKKLLSQAGISEEIFVGTLRWVIGTYHKEKQRARWWSKDNLSKHKGIGQEWTYGTAYMLQNFSRDIRTSAVFSTLALDTPYALEKIHAIESTLARGKHSNILLIGEAGVGKIDLIMAVQKRTKSGLSLASVVEQQIIVLDTNRLLGIYADKQALEVALLNLFDEAVAAGNIVMVIENLSIFIREANALGVFIPELLDIYLASPTLRIIATDTPGAFHTYLEPLGAFTRRFTEILIDSPDRFATVRLLQTIALQEEARLQIVFTFGALEAIAASADRYIVEGVMPDKAIELLRNVGSAAREARTTIITPDFVYTYISEKTGVPVGPISSSERDLLLHLEDRLHERIVGQAEAVTAIAKAMRRARAGIQSADKPIGSFLFLGPTGVGKTETAKALAHLFFKDEARMKRLDMSEYSSNDSLWQLLGDGEHSGILPDMLRENPYCVLLLDEFEKASEAVRDIFLQILDEGMFTDGRGEKVNACNTIIIATSNAGSQLILKTVQQRTELTHFTQLIIDHIIETGVFKPELINRFDSTVIFEPLTVVEQESVANLMLGGLYQRIKAQGYELNVTKDLLTALVEKGYHPEFGARPLLRILQDMVEEKVAEKIIAGTIQKGDTLTLSLKDFPTDAFSLK